MESNRNRIVFLRKMQEISSFSVPSFVLCLGSLSTGVKAPLFLGSPVPKDSSAGKKIDVNTL